MAEWEKYKQQEKCCWQSKHHTQNLELKRKLSMVEYSVSVCG